MSSLIYKLESYEIMGACFEAYKEKGSGAFSKQCIGNVWIWSWAIGKFHSW